MRRNEAIKPPASTGSVGVAGAGKSGSVHWQIAEETAVALMVNSTPFAVMMATPADLVDLGAGFALSEGLVTGYAALNGVLAFPTDGGFVVDIATAAAVAPRSRTLEGRSGCGLCGIEDIADAIRPPRRVTPRFVLTPAAAAAALAGLPAHQPMNQANRSVHGAAWCTSDGRIVMAREDVGRHNALDKLIGALARAGTDPGDGFVAMTSRCSFELVQKLANFGVAHLVTVSAPTSLALDLARRAGITLAAATAGGVVLFAPGEPANVIV